jgi:hypothetical protein
MEAMTFYSSKRLLSFFPKIPGGYLSCIIGIKKEKNVAISTPCKALGGEFLLESGLCSALIKRARKALLYTLRCKVFSVGGGHLNLGHLTFINFFA